MKIETLDNCVKILEDIEKDSTMPSLTQLKYHEVIETLKKEAFDSSFEEIKPITNAEWCVKNGICFSNLEIARDEQKFYIYDVADGRIIGEDEKTSNNDLFTLGAWLDSTHKDKEMHILDEQEKEYLLAVIKPFKDSVVSISKFDNIIRIEYIYTVDTITYRGTADLPIAPPSNFKLMERYKKYNLKDLNLTDDQIKF